MLSATTDEGLNQLQTPVVKKNDIDVQTVCTRTTFSNTRDLISSFTLLNQFPVLQLVASSLLCCLPP